MKLNNSTKYVDCQSNYGRHDNTIYIVRFFVSCVIIIVLPRCISSSSPTVSSYQESTHSTFLIYGQQVSIKLGVNFIVEYVIIWASRYREYVIICTISYLLLVNQANFHDLTNNAVSVLANDMIFTNTSSEFELVMLRLSILYLIGRAQHNISINL